MIATLVHVVVISGLWAGVVALVVQRVRDHRAADRRQSPVRDTIAEHLVAIEAIQRRRQQDTDART